jgi:starch-binding outer membrane protein, SusD/RagB family
MKKIDIKTFLGVSVLSFLLLTTSCEEYLDKAPESDLTEADVFKSFRTFQGFVEDLYQCVVDETLGTQAYANWNFADDVFQTLSVSMSVHFDRGNYWQWQHTQQSPFWGNINSGNNQNAKGVKGYWQSGWYGIRVANIALSHLNDLVGTPEEKNILAGQAYFFRGYLHYEILRAWGGIPYIDTVFAPTDQLNQPRMSYREVANKLTADFQKAAQLLPVSWDETTVGQATLGNNAGRLTKGAAYGYLGKNLLYAASPLMNGMETGSYTYDEELCKQAAAALNEVIKLADQYPQYIGLENWGTPIAGEVAPGYAKNFYTLSYEVPIGKEILFNNPIYLYKRWNYMEHQMTFLGGWSCFSGPTANYIENFGMANGLPIDEADSGFDPTDPWTNRDPRFYYNILKDGDRMILTANNADTWAQLYTGGRHRNASNSIGGFGVMKFKSVRNNSYDAGWGNGYFAENPQMRLADAYLMYAEAVNEAYGPNGSAPGGPTAVEAVNKIRDRAGVPDVDPRFHTKDAFREIIRQERAVELAFEGHRWYDLRRWYVAHEMKYREKFGLEFPADHSFFEKALYTTIVFEAKHYWLPFPTAQVSLYSGWQQNPGW